MFASTMTVRIQPAGNDLRQQSGSKVQAPLQHLHQLQDVRVEHFVPGRPVWHELTNRLDFCNEVRYSEPK